MLRGRIINQGAIVNGGLAFRQFSKLPDGVIKSVDFITLIDILSEGQIEGSATASKIDETDINTARYRNCFLKDTFLNGQPVLKPDAPINNPARARFNYNTVELRFRRGTANQNSLPAAEVQSSELLKENHGDIGEIVDFPKGGNVTSRSVQIDDVDVDIVRVRVKFDQFFQIDKKSGNRKATEVRVFIKVETATGTELTPVNHLVKGKSFSAYSRDYGIRLRNLAGYNKLPLGQSGAFFPITVTLLRDQEGNANFFDTMRLSGVTTIKQDSHSFPHVAHTSLRFSAEEFPSMPSRIFRIRGKRVKIPSNGTVQRNNGRIVYSGNWNGSFKNAREWTSDPAWILYDLLVYNSQRNADQQYGCELPESSIDKFVFQKASQYCGELVDDGQGGQEPRFSLNVNIRNQTEALKLINDICSVMRAMPFYSEGTIKISQDAPKDFANPSAVAFDYVFNNANVVDGNFAYSGSSLKTRFTTINVSYLDLDSQEIDYVTVRDTTAIAKYGESIKTIRTFGTTSRGQAQRVGKWFLNTQQTATESCVFETNIAAGSVVQIGSIIGIADRVKSATRRGGIVKAATTTSVTIDNVDGTNQPDISDSPTISCLLSDGTVKTRTISSYSNNQTVVNVSSAFPSAPVENSPYIFESGSLSVTTWRITNIKETAKKTYAITALKHNQGKYAAVEDGEQLPNKPTNLLVSILPSPSGLTLQEKIVVINNRAVPKVFIDWQVVDGASGYILQYRRDGDNFTRVDTQETTFEIVQSQFEAGTYDIRLTAVNALGEESITPTERDFPVSGLSDPPEQPTGFELEPINNYQVRLSWNLSLAKDVIFGGRCLIRHSTTTLANTTFSNSIDLDTSNGNTTEVVVPALTGTYSIKFEDLAGNLSENEAKVEFALPETEDEIRLKKLSAGQLVDFREQTAFSGTRTRTSVASGALQLATPTETVTGTYSQTDTVLTVTATSHNLIVGDKPQLTFTTGLAFDNSFIITSVPNANTFTVVNSKIENETGTTSGNVTVARGLIGKYDFSAANTLDLGAAYQNLRLKRHIKSEGFNISANFDSIPDLNARLNFDGDAVDRLKARLTVRTSNDNSTFTNFTNLRNGSFVGRHFQFRANLISEDTNENIKFLELGFDASFPSRTENKYISSGNVVSTPIQSGTSASGIDIVFANRFFTGTSDIGGSNAAFLPTVTIAPFDLPSGARFVIKEDGSGNFLNAANQNVNGTGFNIIFKNSSNTPIDVKFSFQAVGYGKGA